MRFPARFIGEPAASPDPRLWARNGSRLEPLSFRRTPLLWAALWFCVGIGAERLGWVPAVVWVMAVLLLAGMSGAAIRTPWVGLVPVAGLWVVAGLGCGEMQPGAATQAELRGFADGLSRTVQGRVMRVRVLPPQARQDVDVDGYEETEGDAGLSVDLGVEAVEEVTPDASRMVPVTGGVRVTVIAEPGVAMPELRCGDVVDVAMRLKVPERFRDPGAWQYGDYLLDQGIGVHASVRAGKLAAETARGAGKAWDLRCRVYAAQAWASGRMLAFARSGANRALPEGSRLTAEDAGTLNAMLFGDRLGLNREMRKGFERTGSFHLFVVSGMHVGLIALGIFWVSRRTRLPMWAGTFVTIGLTTGYAALTGLGIPVQRALGMASIFLIARLLDRHHNTLNALGAAVLGALAWSPSSLFEASFQMTFLAIVGVAGIAIPLGERTILPYARAARRIEEVWRDVRFEPRLAQFRVMLRMFGEALGRLLGRWAMGLPARGMRVVLWVAELCLVALVTEAVMALPMALYFHRVALLALPVNLLTVPVIAFLVPAAMATFCGSLLSPWVAVLPGTVTAVLLHAVAGTVGHIARLTAADVRVPGPASWVCGVVVAGLGFCCWASRQRRAVWGWLTVATLPLLVGLALLPATPSVIPGMLEVTAIDVGQGDSILVVGPNGRAMLVDAGGPVGGVGLRSGSADTGFDVGEEVVAPYLWSRELRRLDVLALTHEHSDHMGGMPAILRSFRPRELWVGVDVPSQAYGAMLAEASALGVRIRHLRAGDALPWDGVDVSVLGPEAEYRNAGAPKNDDSLVMRLQFGKASVLLEGDAERPEEATMLAHDRVGPVTLLKVGHHGSATSSTEGFLAAVSPRDAVISVGRGNTFGHPRGEVITRLAGRGVKLYRTDMFGMTTFLLGRDGGIREVVGTSN
ncbi:ComEC/Rec2 family competence protein [Granulicella sibirica]|uniref:DNA internalization-related competence protein ComEC/Rec2 n=1 Tax=Granulicella sibirica TaxID=2479048 RepID=A0A4Q0T745_9BACT|nr:ComEC/Rec2 family competence protein [Granulicella sibirica]RXH57928.1 DNA internalization-related competence protein ComEC/Rec2 [Granulicella sibirica]